jgi:hypothetical protein
MLLTGVESVSTALTLALLLYFLSTLSPNPYFS